MRIYETWKASPSKRMAGIINYESKLGLYSTKALKMFAARIVTVKIDLLALLLRVKMEGVTIVGISSPARSNTLLGFA